MSRQEEMFALIETWRSSGMSKKSFAREHGIGWTSFRYWVQKYQEQRETTAGFVRIPDLAAGSAIETAAGRDARIRLELADGTVVIVY